MVLHLDFSCECRLCWGHFDPGREGVDFRVAGLGPIQTPPNRAARRAIAPRVCDDCWHLFGTWLARDAREGRRKLDASFALKNPPKGPDDSATRLRQWADATAQFDLGYARFQMEPFVVWLATITRAVASDQAVAHIQALRRAQAERRDAERGDHVTPETLKTTAKARRRKAAREAWQRSPGGAEAPS